MNLNIMGRVFYRILPPVFVIGICAFVTSNLSVQARNATNSSPAASSSAAPDHQESAIAWAKLTQRDLQAAYDITLENHPGAYNELDPGFKDVAAKALEKALGLAAHVENAAGYKYALNAFAVEFRDGHFRFQQIVETAEGERPDEWPGFIMAWRNGKGIVQSALDNQADWVGAEVVACDQRPIREAVLNNVFSFRGNPAVLGDWIEYAPRIFLAQGNPFVSRPEQCIFRLANGVEQRRALHWLPLSSNQEWWDRYILTTDGPEEPLKIEVFGEGRYWISLSTFSPQGENELKQMEALISQIEAQKDPLRNAEAIVFDLRGNSGGSSTWILRMANALWGEPYVQWRDSSKHTYTEYRASKGNLDHLKSLLDLPAITNAPADVIQFLTETITGVERAYNQGEPLYSTKLNPSYGNEQAAASNANLTNPVSAKIYVFMPGPCASACLDAIDLLTQFENVTLLGMPTSADTNYLDVRYEILPSEQSIIVFPIKVYRNRTRPSGFYYEPDIPYPSLDLSRAAIEAWLIDIIGDRSANAVSKRRDHSE